MGGCSHGDVGPAGPRSSTLAGGALCCRCKYEQTLLDIKNAVAKKTGCPADKQQLFWQGRELTAADDKKTLLEMNLHTGFSLMGYDLVRGWAGPAGRPGGWAGGCEGDVHVNGRARLQGLGWR